MRAVGNLLGALLILTATMSAADTDCKCANGDDSGVVIVPVTPITDNWESVKTLSRQQIMNPETQQEMEACVITLEEHPMENGDGIPVNEDGQQLILDSDGMTWVNAGDLLDTVDANTCNWHQ